MKDEDLQITYTIKPCPFCGGKRIEVGIIDNPLVWWDSNIRGEECAYVWCKDCSANIKGEDIKEALMKWERRQTE